MKLAAFVSVVTHTDAQLACEPVNGRPWLARIVDRLANARCVARVVITARPEWCGALRRALGEDAPIVISTEDPLVIAAATAGDHEGVTFCPLKQLFVDPARLDRLAAETTAPETARLLAVLACEPGVALTGGAFLQILTRVGLRAALDDVDLVPLPTVRWPTWPEPREMRLESSADCEWAATACELMAADGLAGSDADLQATIDAHDFGRFPSWDRLGPRPGSLLTVRALREPLFAEWVRYLRRFTTRGVDVICPAAHAEATAAIPGVSRVWPFRAPSFSLAALEAETVKAIGATGYDLCVLPRLEPSGHGYDNVLPLAQASSARVSMWVDVFGRSGLLAGQPCGWERTVEAAPFVHPTSIEARARIALDRFAAETRPRPRRETAPLALGA